MGREVKRVALDFEWPLNKVWAGYCMPEDWPKDEDNTEKWSSIWYENYRYEPKSGEGWQIWENVSEGSPITPVFATAEECAKWAADNDADGWHSNYEQWLKLCQVGWAPSLVISNGIIQTGVNSL